MSEDTHDRPRTPIASGMRRPRRIPWVGGAVVAALIAAGAAVWIATHVGAPSAQEVAEEYLEHIARGEAAAANEMAPPDADLATLLTDDVLSSAVERISEVEVTPRSGADDGSATFDVTYRLAGNDYSGTLELEDRSSGWAPAAWTVVTPLVQTLTLQVAGGARVSLSGVALEQVSTERPGSHEVTLYPAVYPLASLSTFFAPRPDAMVLGTDPYPAHDIDMVPTAALSEKVQALSDALLRNCADRTAVAAECPRDMNWELWEDRPRWTVVELPTITLADDGTAFFVTGGSFTLTPADDTSAVETYVPRFPGRVTVDGDDVAITFAEP
ncbi:MAG: hypothetical protein J7484_06145 [Microbacterium sp.]|nr:hypothetical protein [Microbacterium sp.]